NMQAALANFGRGQPGGFQQMPQAGGLAQLGALMGGARGNMGNMASQMGGARPGMPNPNLMAAQRPMQFGRGVMPNMPGGAPGAGAGGGKGGGGMGQAMQRQIAQLPGGPR